MAMACRSCTPASSGRAPWRTGRVGSPLRRVIMVYCDRVTLDLGGDGLTQGTDEGQLVDGLVRNAGLLHSDGGNVTLVALADTDGDGLSIVHTGVIRARTLENRQGRVVLSAGNDIEIRGEIGRAHV